MKRSLKVSLDLANVSKLTQLNALGIEFSQATNSFLLLLSQETKLDDRTVIKTLPSPLSYAFKQAAARQATGIFSAWKARRGKKGQTPTLQRMSMTLDYRFITVQKNKGNTSFDLWLHLSTLNKGKRIQIPIKSYAYLNSYSDNGWDMRPGGRLTQRDDGTWFLTLTFSKEAPKAAATKPLGIDIGYRKLIVTSDGQVIGDDQRTLITKADRKVWGSKAQLRSRREIKEWVNRKVKEIPWSTIGVLVHENLKYLKSGKSGKWSRNENRGFSFWLYSYSLDRIGQVAEVNGVQTKAVNPRNTSRTCPRCGHVDRLNRNGEVFHCKGCSLHEDADYIGAVNVLRRFTRVNEAPVVKEDR